MRILLTNENDLAYKNNFTYTYGNLVNISDVNFNIHTLDLHFEYINTKERIINLEKFYQKVFGAIPLISVHEQMIMMPRYFRVVISRGKYKYVLSDRYPMFSISTIKKFNFNVSPFYMKYLCYKNKIDILEYLKSSNKLKSIKYLMQSDDHLIDAISNEKHIKVLELLKNSGLLNSESPLKYSSRAIDFASANKQINVLNWWKNSRLLLKYSYRALDHASEFGHVNVLEWWKNSKLPLRYTSLGIDNASHNNHVNILEWWKNSGLELKYSEYSLNWASRNSHVAVLEWWKNSGLPLQYSEYELYAATCSCNIDMLDWWKNSGLPLKYNRDDYLRYLYSGWRDSGVLKWWENSGLLFKKKPNLIERLRLHLYVKFLA